MRTLILLCAIVIVLMAAVGGFAADGSETNITPAEALLDDVPEEATKLLGALQQYGGVFVNALYLIVIGLAIVFFLHRLSSRPLARRIRNRRLLRVGFGFLYALVMVVAVLLAVDRMGFDTERLAKLALLLLVLGAIASYFLSPFFPRLPFTLGQMVDIGGVLGHVDSISQFHTMIRTLDGQIVFIPNPLVLSSKITNYHAKPTRRIELPLSVNNDSDVQATIDQCMELMRADSRVLEEPAPTVFVVGAKADGVDLTAFCWVRNEDWFRTRSDLWLRLVDRFLKDRRLALSLPQQEVFLMQYERSSAPAEDAGTPKTALNRSFGTEGKSEPPA